MLERAGNDHRQYELALIVCKRGIHEAANLRAAHLLADGLVQHSRYMQVERLIGQIDQAGRGQGAAINHGFEIIGLGKTIFHVEVSRELDEVSKALGSTKAVAQEFSH